MGGGALALALWAGAVIAQDFPALYDVTGVAAGDVLNIRAMPDAGADILASYPPTRLGVEVLRLSPDGRWAEVGLPEGNGWVALRYLAAVPQSDTLPLPLRCSGTEPFWTLALAPEASGFRTPEGHLPLTLTSTLRARNGFTASLVDDAGENWQVTAQVMQCSDGMSDRMFGLRALVAGRGGEDGGGGPEIYAGCCTFEGG